MTWQAAAFAILALALATGFAWYERSRPDARIVALVATLAAFAALGRIAFAAVPNVKPTTDIVLIAGFALGGGPGFAVGAIAGLTSNFFFGQGPWTPWQMAAWGATGLIGAGLARLVSARGGGHDEPHVGRWPLAALCGVVGFGFTAVQDVGDWVTFSDHSGAQLGAYVGQGLGFDAIHAAGCVAFALAFGPALVRAIQRFARRLEVRWVSLPPGPAAIVALAVLAGLATAGIGLREAPAARAAGVGSPATYLLGAQNADGGFGAAPGQPSSQLYSGWAALGLASAGDRLADIVHGGPSVLDYVRAGASVSDPGSIERTILVADAAGESATAFGGQNLIARLQGDIGSDGAVQDEVNLTSFAILALRGAGIAPPPASAAWLERQQDHDGGFSFSGAGGSSDVDDTGAALEALAGDGGPAVAVRERAIAYLRREQDRDGGFPSQPGSGSNAQSTAWAIQGLDASGVSPDALHHGGPSPLDYLRSLIGPDGQIAYAQGQQQTPVWVTGEALMALEGRPLPVAAPSTPAPSTPRSSRSRRSRPAAAHRVRHRTRVRSRRRPRRARPRHPSAAPKSTAMQSIHLCEDVGTLTGVLLAPVGAG